MRGRPPPHGLLFGQEAQLRAEVLAQVAALGHERLWLEKVRIETAPPAAGFALRSDAVAELHALLQEAEGDADFLRQLQDDLAPFIGKLPHELRAELPSLELVSGGQLDALVRQVAPGLLDHIARAEQA